MTQDTTGFINRIDMSEEEQREWERFGRRYRRLQQAVILGDFSLYEQEDRREAVAGLG